MQQPTRMEAFVTMRRALSEFRVEAIHTTIALHRDGLVQLIQ
jgi:biotin carboxylase